MKLAILLIFSRALSPEMHCNAMINVNLLVVVVGDARPQLQTGTAVTWNPRDGACPWRGHNHQ